MRRMALVVAVVGLVVSSCSGGGDGAESASSSTPPASPTGTAVSPTPELRTDYDIPPWNEIVAMYDYDTSEPLDYQVIEEKDQEWMRQWDMDPSSATVYDVTYQSSGYTVPAWLVIPEGQGPFPAVIYAHGKTFDRDMHLAEAVALAREGYVGLAITGPEAREPYAMFWTGFADQDIAGETQYVTDLRRAIDLLGTLPEVDASRLGLAGLSLGCEVGSIMSGLEDRIDAYVLMSCVGYSTDPQWSGIAYTGETLTRYQDEIAVLNPVNYVVHNQGAAFLIQASKTDVFASEANIRALFDAAPEPKELWWYTYDIEGLGGHALGCISEMCDPSVPAFAFHLGWLQENI